MAERLDRIKAGMMAVTWVGYWDGLTADLMACEMALLQVVGTVGRMECT